MSILRHTPLPTENENGDSSQQITENLKYQGGIMSYQATWIALGGPFMNSACFGSHLSQRVDLWDESWKMNSFTGVARRAYFIRVFIVKEIDWKSDVSTITRYHPSCLYRVCVGLFPANKNSHFIYFMCFWSINF